jgi:hypothetical protein
LAPIRASFPARPKPGDQDVHRTGSTSPLRVGGRGALPLVGFFDDRSLVDVQSEWAHLRWLSVISIVVLSAVALLVQSTAVAVATASRDHRPVLRSVRDEVRQAIGLSTALAASGTLIALAERPMGIIALPVFLVPLVLTQFAVRRFAGIRETYGETIRTRPGSPRSGAIPPPDHPSRVASLSLAMGHDLGCRNGTPSTSSTPLCCTTSGRSPSVSRSPKERPSWRRLPISSASPWTDHRSCARPVCSTGWPSS